MAAPKKNQFWRLRSKNGKERKFPTSEALWEAACEYFEWCDSNPWRIEKTKKKGRSKEVETTPTQRPYTISGLCMFLGCGEKFLYQLAQSVNKQSESNSTDTFTHTNDEDYSYIITRIKQIIETNQLEGAMVGAYNANIVSRINGLTDKMDIESGGEKLKAVIQVQVVNTGVPLASSEDEIAD